MIPANRAAMGWPKTIVVWGLVSYIAISVLSVIALRMRPDASRLGEQPTVRVYCAAGVSHPIEQALAEFNRHHEIQARVERTGGSGRLLGLIVTESKANIARGADLFISADATLITRPESKGVFEDSRALAYQQPVLATYRGSGIQFTSLKQLADAKDLRFGIASEHAAIGKVTREIASRASVLDELLEQRKMECENVMQLAMALRTKTIEVAIVWDSVVEQINNESPTKILEVLGPAEEGARLQNEIVVASVRSSPDQEAALVVAEFLSAEGGGLKALREAGFATFSENARF